jgi:SAM-dependent methyltransferase
MHHPWRSEYDSIADALATALSFYTVVDLGCGNGYILERLKSQWHKAVQGYDGSTAATTYGDYIKVADLTQPLAIGKFDLVICTELGEHLPPSAADTLVGTICNTADSLVFFSAALVGYGGYLHSNEQPTEYWIARFKRHGWSKDEAATTAIMAAMKLNELWWFKNAYLMTKQSP